MYYKTHFEIKILKNICLGKDVTYLCPFSGPARGISYVTNYKLVFKADEVRDSFEKFLCFNIMYFCFQATFNSFSNFFSKIFWPNTIYEQILQAKNINLLLQELYTQVCMVNILLRSKQARN